MPAVHLCAYGTQHTIYAALEKDHWKSMHVACCSLNINFSFQGFGEIWPNFQRNGIERIPETRCNSQMSEIESYNRI